MREVTSFQNRNEIKPPTFNPNEFSLSSSNTNSALFIIKGNGETTSIFALLKRENSTAQDFSKNPSTKIHNENAFNGNTFFLIKTFQNLFYLNLFSHNWDGYN